MKIAVALLSLAVYSNAATYYVDFSAGNDASSGTSVGSAWQRCPGDTNAASVSASTSLSIGDTVIFKGGVAYSNTIPVSWPGVTYDGNSAGTFGTGRAIMSGGIPAASGVAATNRTYGFYGSSAKANLSFKNFEFQFYGGNVDTNGFDCASMPDFPGYGIYLTQPSNLTIDGCYFHDIGSWQNAVTNFTQGNMDGEGITLYQSASGVIITNCEFTTIARSGLDLNIYTFATNINIINCRIHDYIRWGIQLTINAHGGLMRDVTIDGLSVSNIWQYSNPYWQGCLNGFPHVDGVFAFIGGSPAKTNVSLGTPSLPITIRNSLFCNNGSDRGNMTGGGNCMIFLSTWGGSVYIYNNLFINTLGGVGAINLQDGVSVDSGSSQPDYLIANNTSYDDNFFVTLTSPSYALTNGVVAIKNNAIYHGNSNAAYPIQWWADQESYPTTQDYNIYYTLRPDTVIASVNSGGVRVFWKVSDFQANGYEDHGKYADPTFVNISYGLGLNSSLNDLRIPITSPACKMASNLSSVFAVDRNGISRPASGSWDAGAYQETDFNPFIRVLP